MLKFEIAVFRIFCQN